MDLEGGVFVASEDGAISEAKDSQRDPEHGLCLNQIPGGAMDRNKTSISSRTVKAMQWFNPSHIEQLEYVSNKLQTSQIDRTRRSSSVSTTEDASNHDLQTPPSGVKTTSALGRTCTRKDAHTMRSHSRRPADRPGRPPRKRRRARRLPWARGEPRQTPPRR